MEEMPAPNSESPKESSVSIEFKPLEYEVRLLAYIDILGWSKLVERSESDPEELNNLNLAANFFRFATYATESTRSFFAQRNSPDDVRNFLVDVTHFSDTLVLSCPLNSFASASFIGEVQKACHHLLCLGHYTRGAIVLGKLAHRDNVVLGPALIEAYRLEREVAKYPRVIIKPDAIPYLNRGFGTDLTNTSYTYLRNVRLDTDGIYYVDILGLLAGFQNEPRRKHGTEDHIVALVKAKLDRDAHDLGRLAKHTWMLKYLEQILAECGALSEGG